MKNFTKPDVNSISKPLVNVSKNIFYFVIGGNLLAEMQPWDVVYATPWKIEIGANQIAKEMTMKDVTKRVHQTMKKTGKGQHELNILFDYVLFDKLKEKCLSEEVANYPKMNKKELAEIATEKGLTVTDDTKETLIKRLTLWSV